MAKQATTDAWSVTGKLTEALAKALTPPGSGNRIRWHGELAGFGCRVTAAGTRAWVLRYRNADGRDRTLTIGDANSWPLADAMKKAKALRRQVYDGQDPLAERQDQRSAPTVADLCERYRADKMVHYRPSTAREVSATIDTLILPKLGKLKVGSVRHTDVDRWHREIGQRARFRANRSVAYLSAMFSLAIKLEWCTANPCKGIERFAEPSRERYLTAEEIARLLRALDQHPYQTSANAIRLLLYSGARRGETLSATWDQFDLQAGIWTKPHGSTKQKRTHRVPLSQPALALLTSMRREVGDSQYLFPGGGTQGALQDVRKTWAWTCRKAGISGCRLHDLRHSYASVLASAGLSLPIIGQLLGHSNPTTTSRYSHLLDSALKDATEQAGAIISGKVVPLRRVS